VGVTGVMGVEGVASVAFVLLESRLPFMVGSESRGRISNGGVEGTSFFFPPSLQVFFWRGKLSKGNWEVFLIWEMSTCCQTTHFFCLS